MVCTRMSPSDVPSAACTVAPIVGVGPSTAVDSSGGRAVCTARGARLSDRGAVPAACCSNARDLRRRAAATAWNYCQHRATRPYADTIAPHPPTRQSYTAARLGLVAAWRQPSAMRTLLCHEQPSIQPAVFPSSSPANPTQPLARLTSARQPTIHCPRATHAAVGRP